MWSGAARGRVVDYQCKQLSDPLPEHNLIISGDFDDFLANSGRFCGRLGGHFVICKSLFEP